MMFLLGILVAFVFLLITTCTINKVLEFYSRQHPNSFTALRTEVIKFADWVKLKGR